MSASNWAACPQCAKVRQVQLDEMREQLKASYGVVSVEQFDQARQQLTEAESTPAPQTLREDYEIDGAQDGTVIVKYGCSCRECGLESEFTYRHELEV